MTYPSYTATASSAGPVNETTFLLCKPDAEYAHRTILQLVSEAGFQVQAKSFRITPSVAQELARMFPSVRRRKEAARHHGARPQPEVAPAGADRTGAAAVSASTELAATAAAGSSGVVPWTCEPTLGTAAAASRRYEDASADEWLAMNVDHLLRAGTCLALTLCAPSAVERLLELVGPENPAVAQRIAPRSLRAQFGTDLLRNAVHAAATLTEANAAIQTVFGYEPRYAAIESRATAAASSGSTTSGACAVEDRLGGGAGAVEGLGLGGEVGEAVAGYSGVRPPRQALRLTVGGSLSAGGFTTIGPARSALGYRRGLPEPVTLNALLSPVVAQSPTWPPTTVTGVLPPAARGLGGLPLISPVSDTPSVAGRSNAGGGGGVHGGDLALLSSLTDMAGPATMSTSLAEGQLFQTQQQREALAFYERIVHQQQLLRIREVDLLLREQAFQDRTGPHAQTPSPSPSCNPGAVRGGPDIMSSLVAESTQSGEPRGRHPDSPGVVSPHAESEIDELGAFHPRVRARTRKGEDIYFTPGTVASSANNNNSRTGGLSRTSAAASDKAATAGKTAASHATVAVEHTDVVPLIQLPERRQALFAALDREKVGSVSAADFVALYERSPAIQLCQPDDHAIVRQLVNTLTGGPRERMDYNTFTLALLRLLKQ